MPKTIYTAMSGAVARLRQLDVATNNMANATTAGYRETRMAFDELLATMPNPLKGQVPIGMERRSVPLDSAYVSTGHSATSQVPGGFVQTDNPLDLAIEGNAWLAVAGDPMRLTRDGRLRVDASGILVTANGTPVLGTSGSGKAGAIAVPREARVTLDPSGQVLVDDNPVARLQLVQVREPAALRHDGGGFYVAADGDTPRPAPEATIQPGYIEKSDADPLQTLIEVIAAQRAFEASQRVLEVAGELDRRAASEVGRLK